MGKKIGIYPPKNAKITHKKSLKECFCNNILNKICSFSCAVPYSQQNIFLKTLKKKQINLVRYQIFFEKKYFNNCVITCSLE